MVARPCNNQWLRSRLGWGNWLGAIAFFGTFFRAALWHARPPYQRIQGGMTKEEVRYILGRSARMEQLVGEGDWMLPDKLPHEEEELWSTTQVRIKLAYNDRGKVIYRAVRKLTVPK